MTSPGASLSPPKADQQTFHTKRKRIWATARKDASLVFFPPAQEEIRKVKKEPMEKRAKNEKSFSFFISDVPSIKNTKRGKGLGPETAPCINMEVYRLLFNKVNRFWACLENPRAGENDPIKMFHLDLGRAMITLSLELRLLSHYNHCNDRVVRKEWNRMKNRLRDMIRYAPGLILILMGVIIMVFPMLLVAFVSAFLVVVGVIAIALAYQTKRLKKGMSHIFDGEPFESSFWHRTQEIFCRRPWH